MDPNELLPLIGAQPVEANPPTDYASLLGYSTPAPVQPVQPDPSLSTPAQDPASTFASPAPIASAGVGISQSGYSPAANAAIQKGPGSRLDKTIAKDTAAVESSFAPIQADAEEASKAAIDAELQGAQIESQRFAATSAAKLKIAGAHHEFLAKEQAAVDNSKAEADSAYANYQASLMDYAAAKVNPAQLWDSTGSFGQFSMIATAFGHDFLAAKGIQTSGLDSIKQAIQNNINSQLENMRKKENVAQGFKQLWDMQRAQSASDGEARARLNGFYLTAMGNHIESQLAGYDSELALAKGQMAKAKIQEEKVKNDLLVRQHMDNAANQRADQRVRVYSAELAASSARYSADAHLAAAKIGREAKPVDPKAGLIYNTTPEGKNTAVRRFHADVPPKDQVEKKEQTSKVLHTSRAIQDLIEKQRLVDKTPPTDLSAFKKLQSEAQRAAEQVRQLVRNSLLYDNTGKAINEQEMKIQNDMVAKKDWWTNGDNTRNLALYGKFNLDKQNEIMSQISDEIQPGDPAYGHSSGTRKIGEELSTVLDIESQPGSGKPNENEPVAKYTGWAQAPNAGQAFDPDKLPDKGPGNKATVKHDWEQFKKDNPWAAPIEEADKKRRRGPEDDPFDAVAAENQANPDRAFIQLERLADLALGGDEKAKETIEAMAAGKPGTSIEGLMAAYAQWEKKNKGL